ncbi:MAG: toprim domain-containing protein, partial [Candidatus Omnitrophica bacterium]|nr:toprim domain-containing protein [Candidatus Omnitrophota bacterium]
MIPTALSEMGIQFSEQSGQIVTECPYCGTGNHLYIDPGKRVFYCQRCGEKGTWRALSEQLGVKPSGASIQPIAKKEYKHPTDEYVSSCHKKLLGPSGTKAVEYLYARKITLDAIHHFKIGLEKKDEKEWIVIPYYSKEKPVNVKYRSIPPAPKEFRRWKDGESVLFNEDCLKPLKDDEDVLIVEGEIDCLTLWSQGITNVVSTSIGASGIKPEWIEKLERFKSPVIIYDNDGPGQKGAKELAKRLDLDSCRNVVLPVKDSNDFFVGGRPADDFKRLVSEAACFPVDNILTMEQVFKSLM